MQRIATSLPYTELPVAIGNFDTTRKPIDRIVIHTMVGSWQGAAARFNNPTSQVSAHYGIKLGGGLIHWLEEMYTGYHAGNYDMNQRSIGIEHEDGGDYNGIRPDVLYTASAKLVADICKFYSIPIDRQHILKHSEVKATGCPDALDIERIVREAYQISHPPESPPTGQPTTPQPTPTPPTPVPPTPPPIQPGPPEIDYKSYLVRIGKVIYGKRPWWSSHLIDQRITDTKKILGEAGIKAPGT